MYGIEYSDLKKDFNNAGIDEQWLPTNYADYIIKKLDNMSVGNSSKSTNESDNTNQTIRSFKNNVSLTFPKMPTISNAVSTKDKLQSKY
jgi:hypothetical protein